MSSGKALSRFHQPISVPGRRLLKGLPLRFVAKKVAGGGGKSLNHDVPLIPFIDFLLCIVLFLLASFSASGELPVDKNVELPQADNVEDMTTAPMVAITGQMILVDGKYCFVGSANLDVRSIDLNFEIGVATIDASIHPRARALFERRIGEGVRITEVPKSWLIRSVDGFCRLMSPLL